MTFLIKIYKNKKLIQTTRSYKKRRFLKNARLIAWAEHDLKVYLKVNYGKDYDVWGKYDYFYNDGDYFKKKDFWLALDAFCEKD